MIMILKLLISSLIFMASAEVTAGYYPADTAAQKTFSKNIKRGQYKSAMKAFDQTFEDTYKSSVNGYALQSLLMYKSGMPLNAVRILLSLKTPNKIDTELKNLWAKALPVNSPVWKVVNNKVSSKWSSVFPYIGNYTGYLYPHYAPKNLKQLKKLEKKKINSVIMSDWNNFQLGLWNGILDRPARGIDFLNKIPSNTKTVDMNHVHLARARLHYQSKNYSKAIISYQKISKKSDSWAIALEEQAHTYTIMGKDNLSLAKLKSLFSPVLINFAGPEPYMLTAFNQEQNCDYISSFKTIGQYKKTFLPRATSLKAISKGEQTPAIKHLLAVQANKNLDWQFSSKYVNKLPTHFYNDKFLVKYFDGRSNLSGELKLLNTLNVTDSFASQIREYSDERISYLEKKITKRLAFLAKRDLKGISNITKKMHLIEAEVIQQLHIAKDIKKASSFSKPNSKEVLVFPDDGEVWMDEIDKYSASIGFCKKKKGK